MAAVPSTRARWSTDREAPVRVRVWTSGDRGAIGASRVHNEPSQPAPRAPETEPSQ